MDPAKRLSDSQRFARKGKKSWATCPLTENGFIRIASHPPHPNRPGDAFTVLAILRKFCQIKGHQFRIDDITILDWL
jgi:hypothetical protein